MQPTSVESPVRLGLIGLGDWGHQVARAAELDPAVTLITCYARTPGTRKTFADRYGCRPCASYQEMLRDPDVEGIVIMTPNTAHREQVLAAAEHGKHCLVTKPIATSIEDGKAMIHACQKAGVILAVGHQSRREPAIRELKGLLESGALGTPVLVECNISTARGFDIQADQWRWAREECPGGPLAQLGIHHIDTIQYLLGLIVQVQGWQRRLLVPADIDDVTCTLLEFESGLLGYLGSAYATSQACWIKVYGTEAVAHYDQHSGLMLSQDTWQTGPVRQQIAPGMKLDTVPIPTMQEEVAEFAACIRTGKEPDIGGAQALRNLAVVLAAVESNQTGRAIAIDDVLASG